MKRFVSGLLAGMLIMMGGTVFANSSGLLGKSVQGIFVIEKEDGRKIGDAVVLDGAAYAPVRIISEATGVSLRVEGKRIVIVNQSNITAETITPPPENKATAANTDISTNMTEDAKKSKLEYLNWQKQDMERQLKLAQDTVKQLSEVAIPTHESFGKYPQIDEAKKSWQKRLDELKADLELAKQSIPQLQKKIADLQEQIAVLNQ